MTLLDWIVVREVAEAGFVLGCVLLIIGGIMVLRDRRLKRRDTSRQHAFSEPHHDFIVPRDRDLRCAACGHTWEMHVQHRGCLDWTGPQFDAIPFFSSPPKSPCPCIGFRFVP